MPIVRFELDREHIELNQLLKLTGVCDSGGAGKHLVATGAVRVDGAVELRKTCKIRGGQRIDLRLAQILARQEDMLIERHAVPFFIRTDRWLIRTIAGPLRLSLGFLA